MASFSFIGASVALYGARGEIRVKQHDRKEIVFESFIDFLIVIIENMIEIAQNIHCNELSHTNRALAQRSSVVIISENGLFR